MAKRDVPVDTLRGIACLLLVTMHVIGYDPGSGIRVPDDSAYRWYTDSFVYLRMPLFSFLAGFVYAWRPIRAMSQYPGFMLSKVRRLLVPYVIFVPLIGIAMSIVPDTNNPTDLAPWEWFIYSLSPYWFLLATFWIFAVVAILDGLKALESPVVVIGIVVALGVVNTFVSPNDVEFLQLSSALSLSTFFMAGVAASRFDWRTRGRVWGWVALVATIVLFAYAQAGIFDLVPVVDSRTNLIGMMLGIAFPLAFLALGVKARWLAWIGGYSSGIFLVHPFLAAGARAVFTRIGVTDPTALFVIGSLAGIFGSIAVTILLQRFLVGRVVLGEKARLVRESAGSTRRERAGRRP